MTRWFKDRFDKVLSKFTEDFLSWCINHVRYFVLPLFFGVGLWMTLATFLEGAQIWLRADQSVPGYLLATIPIVTFALPLSFTRLRRTPAHLRYICDFIDGVIWRWRWSDDRPAFNSIAAYCPQCDHQLVPWQANISARYPIYLDCENCGFRTPYYPREDFSDLRAKIARHIMRHYRDGTWRHNVTRVREARAGSSDE